MRSGPWLALLCMLASTGCIYDATEVLVAIDTDAPPDRLLTIRVTLRSGAAITGPGETRVWTRGGGGLGADGGRPDAAGIDAARSDGSRADTTPGDALPDALRAIGLPATFAVIPGDGRPRDRDVTLVVEAQLEATVSGQPAITFRRIAHMRFVPRTRTLLPIFLSTACGQAAVGCTSVPSGCTVSVRCEEQMRTCGDRGTCVSREVTPSPLDRDAMEASLDTAPSDGRADAVPSDVPADAAPSDVRADAPSDIVIDPLCFPPCPDGAHSHGVCRGGVCGLLCDADFDDCDRDPSTGCEVSLLTSPNHCGMCGRACPATQSCSGGACVATCPPGQVECGAARSCIDTMSDVSNCGSCGNACPGLPHAQPVCAGGSCGIRCDAGFGDCDGAVASGCESDLASSTDHCGACSNACPTHPNSSPGCASGSCVYACAGGFSDCNGAPGDGCEVSTANDVDNCSACGAPCPTRANAIRTCSGSACAFACNGSFRDCNGSPADGCEVDTSNDVSQCGNCGAVCNLANATPVCAGSNCVIGACNGDHFDVDGAPGNGCECFDDTPAASCGGAISLGSVGAGGGRGGPVTNIVAAGGEDWYARDFPRNEDFPGHGSGVPHIGFGRNDGGVFAFDVRVGCPGGALGTCGGSLTDWSYEDTCAAGDTNCSTRDVPWPDSVFVRVFRASPGLSCASYQLSVSR